MPTPACPSTHQHGAATATCALSQGHAGAHCNGAQPTLWWPNLTQPVLKPEPTDLAPAVLEHLRALHAATNTAGLADAHEHVHDLLLALGHGGTIEAEHALLSLR